MIRLFLATLALITATTLAQPSHPWASEPYLGLAVRDTEHGVVVGWVYPGPLGGQSFTSSAGIRRADNLVSINTAPIASRDQFTDLIKTLTPGVDITITFRRSPQADMNASVPKGGPGGPETTITVTLSSRDEWSGTVARGLGDRTIPLPRRGEYEGMIRDHAQKLGALTPDDGLSNLIDHLQSVQEDAWDPNTLAHIAHAFQKPLALDGIAMTIDEQIDRIRGTRVILSGDEDPDINTILVSALSVIDFSRTEIMAHAKYETPYSDSLANAVSLMRTMNESWSIDPAKAESQIDTIRMSEILIRNELQDALDRLNMYYINRINPTHADILSFVEAQPDWGCTGQVVDPTNDKMKIALIGGPGDNTYDMSRAEYLMIIDLGGNDTYIWPEDFDLTSNGSSHIIIDYAGNDTYRSDTEFAGPGVGVFGGSIIDDHSGNDTYTSTKLASMATGLFGIGIILDRAGNDTYTNTGPESGWSQGVGFYGIGLIIDREGSDVYHAEKLSQGVGGPRGFGAIIDGGGNDLYQANGPNYASAYGTPGVYLGMSQGFGFGVRGYAAGGVGLIDDMGGNDQYIAGEFSQGGGYYFGLGMIRDHTGNDLYHGNRYGQAFAAHQAVGILIDDSGDDTYWSMTAASQSGVWDESITLLLDKAGNDSYRCDGLGIGAASMQAIGIFIDLGGDDRYSANPGATLGQSGGNSYHYDTAGVMSFSGFFDLGGGNDIYAGDRANNQSKSTGSRNEDAPENSGLYGVFVDE